MGRFSYLLESILGTAGEFNYDRAVYQMKEAWQERQENEEEVKPAAQVFERYAQMLRERWGKEWD